MNIALDSNILVYFEGVNGPDRAATAQDLLLRLPTAKVRLPAQALGETYRVLTGKARWPRDQAKAAVLAWVDAYELVPTSASTLTRAVEVAAAHHLQIWDAIILAAATEADCRLLLSGDMQDGFTYAGVTVANPFAEPMNPLLAATLEIP